MGRVQDNRLANANDFFNQATDKWNNAIQMANWVEEAQSSLARQQVHSGLLGFRSQFFNDYSDSNRSENRVFGGYSNISNAFQAEVLEAVVNGYKFRVSNKDPLSATEVPNRTFIKLSEPPTFGTRDDLVFLEQWFTLKNPGDPIYVDGNVAGSVERNAESYEKVLEWRIRTVANIDFSDKPGDAHLPEGFTMVGRTQYWKYSSASPTAQGGNDQPVTPLTESEAIGASTVALRHFVSTQNRNDGSVYFTPIKHLVSDYGLYVAGDGTQTSKDLLKTADGYVYAIPLFRVKRLNSGGYREDNLNGARDYYKFKNITAFSSDKQEGTVFDLQVDSIPTQAKVGDSVKVGAYAPWGKILVINTSTNTITMQMLRTTSLGGSYDNELVSDRPDGKYSNIVHKDDIIDLRHRVSLTGFNYQQLLEENFDKLLRGELQTKDKSVMVKERLGLTPAPLGLQSQLMPVKVKGNDGVERDLTNLLGVDGDFENSSVWRANLSTISFDTSNALYGKTAIKVVSNNSSYGSAYIQSFPIDPNKYYLYAVDVKNGDAINVKAYVDGIATSQNNGNIVTDTSYKLSYRKLSPTDLVGKTSINPHIFVTGASGKYAYADGARIFEIDQATYDKIDVDPEFTGDKLAQKFPYVSSYLNVVDNIFNKDEVPYVKSANVTVNVSNDTITIGSATASSWNHVAYRLFLKPNTKYRLTSKNTKLGGASTSIGSINIMQDDGTTNVASVGTGDVDRTFTVPSNGIVRLYMYATGSEVESGSASYTNLQIQEDASFIPKYVPFGKWVANTDFINGQTPTRLVDVTRHSQLITFSDAQTSLPIVEIVESTKTPQKHITVTQATVGQWSANDTIKIKSDNGVITGRIDSDTALAKITSVVDSGTLIVDDVSKLSVGDKLRFSVSLETVGANEYTVNSIDTTTKQIVLYNALNTAKTTDFGGGGNYVGTYLIESTASSSSPATTAAGLAGTWSGLGTKEATFTITTAPTTVTDNIRVQYSVNYPAGKGLTSLPSEVFEARVNGEKLVKASDNIVRIKANFEGKVPGNTDLVPHKSYRKEDTALNAPSTFAVGDDSSQYSNLSKLDGQLVTKSVPSNSQMAQHLFSFNLIRLLEDKLGEQFFNDCLTVADKVAKVKSVISAVVCNWWGKGSGPGSTSSALSAWNVTNTAWNYGYNHTNTTITKLSHVALNSASLVSQHVDSNGFIHFLAYAVASDGVTQSVIETDYIDFELSINVAEAGYDVFVPENQFPVLVDNPSRFKEGENMIPPFTDPRWTIHANAKVVSSYEMELNATDAYQNSIVKVAVNPNQTYVLSGIYSDPNLGVVINLLDASGATVSTPFNTYFNSDKKFTVPSNAIVASIGFFNYTNTVKTYKFTNPVLTPGEKAKPFVPYNKNVKRKRKLDFLGKVAGSTFENPHKMRDTSSSVLTNTPESIISGAERNQNEYDSVARPDGVLRTRVTPTTGQYSQYIYEFDLSHLGLSLTELKSALRKLTVKWTGYGKGDNAGTVGYGASAKGWNANTQAWGGAQTNTTSSPSTLTHVLASDNTGSKLVITNDQKVYYLVHSTYPAGTASPSEIYTDYISLEVELADYVDYVKASPVKVRKETKELKLQYSKVSYRTGREDVIELFYNSIPYQGISKPSDIKVLTDIYGFVTSYGSGSPKPSNLSMVSYPYPIVSLLPLPNNNKVHEFINDNLQTGSQSITRITHLIDKAEYEEMNHQTSSGYRKLKVGDETNIGSAGSPATQGLNTLGIRNYMAIKNLTKSSKPLYILMFLVKCEYELTLVVHTSTHSILGADAATHQAVDMFKLQGRPLIKGVN